MIKGFMPNIIALDLEHPVAIRFIAFLTKNIDLCHPSHTCKKERRLSALDTCLSSKQQNSLLKFMALTSVHLQQKRNGVKYKMTATVEIPFSKISFTASLKNKIHFLRLLSFHNHFVHFPIPHKAEYISAKTRTYF
uniref:Uncharacterized protein n=1 Tax=Glossina austeni TaxID=7395 RepID=A0A1A9UZ97_GLOAU